MHKVRMLLQARDKPPGGTHRGQDINVSCDLCNIARYVIATSNQNIFFT